MQNNSIEFASIKSDFGEIVCVWQICHSMLKIKRIFLSNLEVNNNLNGSALSMLNSTFPEANLGSHPLIEKLFNDIILLLQGKNVDFSEYFLHFLDFEQCWGKQASIIRKESEISLGKISTYALLAENCGITKGARVAARALAQNPFPLIIPCHRTVRSDGDLGGYQGGLKMKQFLLEKEGILCEIITNSQKGTKRFRIKNWNLNSLKLLYPFTVYVG